MTLLQEISLYIPPEDLPEPNLSFLVIMKILGGIIFLLAMLYGVSFGYFFYQNKSIVAMEKKSESVHAELVKKTKEYNTELDEAQFNVEIRALTVLKKQKIDALSLLRAQGINNGVLFSNFFAALSERHVLGTWYTSININKNGSYLVLDGLSIKPEMVPEILDEMQKESVFDGRIFNQFLIKRVDDQSVSFHIETGTGGGK